MTGRQSRFAVLALMSLATGAGCNFGSRSVKPVDPLGPGQSAYEHGDWKGAEANAREVLATKKDDPDALRLLARASARLGKDDTAKRIFQRLGIDTMQPEDHLVIALSLLREGRRDEARDALQIALHDQRNLKEAVHELARIYLEKDRLNEAADLVEPLTRDPTWTARAGLVLGMLRDLLHDPGGAAGAIKEALANDPTLKGAALSPLEARKLLARVLLKIHHPDDARDQLTMVLKDGADPEASWLLSRAALQSGDKTAAANALAQAGTFATEHPERWEPAPYVGAAKCAECHEEIAQTQQSSHHAQTFRRIEDVPDLPLPTGPVGDPHDPKVVHTIERRGKGLDARAKVGDQDLLAVVQYILGSGDRAFTLVGRDEKGAPRELRLSSFHTKKGDLWDVTTGHLPNPGDIHEFLGQTQSKDGMRTCLNCHTTNFRAVSERSGPEAADHAIGCERCHGPGGNHLAAVSASFPDLAIGRPRLATNEAINQLCGQCHGLNDRPVPANIPNFLVRFQATTLPMSRCYTQTNGGLGCTTCHSPHRDPESSPAFYEAKCLACHGPEAHPGPAKKALSHAPKLPEGTHHVVCPVDPARGCIGCHMPAEKGPMPHSLFTNHQIRVHGPAAKADRITSAKTP